MTDFTDQVFKFVMCIKMIDTTHHTLINSFLTRESALSSITVVKHVFSVNKHARQKEEEQPNVLHSVVQPGPTHSVFSLVLCFTGHVL